LIEWHASASIANVSNDLQQISWRRHR
jgi:hypothetical protein